MKSLFILLFSTSLCSSHPASACTLFPTKDAVVRGPQVSVANTESGLAAVTIKGPAAKAIFELLTHSLVQVQKHWLAEKRTGFGLDCSRRQRWDGTHYSCLESFSDGKTLAHFKFTPAVQDSSQLLFLKIQGEGPKTLFESMSSEINPETFPDGSTLNKKISGHLTCAQLIDNNQSMTYSCEQILSPAGYSWGTGTAPMIGAGTLPLYINAE